MLIDKYEADNIFAKVPGLTLQLSPELAAIDLVLDDDELFTMMRNDLARTTPNKNSRSPLHSGRGYLTHAGGAPSVQLEL